MNQISTTYLGARYLIWEILRIMIRVTTGSLRMCSIDCFLGDKGQQVGTIVTSTELVIGT